MTKKFKRGEKVIYMRHRFAASIEDVPSTVDRVTPSGHIVILQNDGRRVTVAYHSLRKVPT